MFNQQVLVGQTKDVFLRPVDEYFFSWLESLLGVNDMALIFDLDFDAKIISEKDAIKNLLKSALP